MHANQRARFPASVGSVSPSVTPFGGIGPSHASNARGGQVGGSTGGVFDGSHIVVPHPLQISRTNDSSKVGILTDDPFDGSSLGGSALLGRGDALGCVALDTQHAAVCVGQFDEGIGPCLLCGKDGRVAFLVGGVATGAVGLPMRPCSQRQHGTSSAEAQVQAWRERNHGTIPTSVPRWSIVMIRLTSLSGRRVDT